MIPFPKYASIKDKYCICYFGPVDEYLVCLRLVRPIIERKYPGLRLHFGCKDDKAVHLNGCEILKVSEIKMRREEFAHVRELRFNGKDHPVEQLMEECDIPDWAVRSSPADPRGDKCVILSKSDYPTKPLETPQIDFLKKKAKSLGHTPLLNEPWKGAGVVMGVESVGLLEAAAAGAVTYLVPNGVGTRLYKRMFPFLEVVHT